MSTSGKIFLVIIIAVVALGALRTILSAAGFKVPTTIDTWKTYVRGPGMLQLVFLLLGAAVVVPGVYFSRWRNPPPVSQVKEFRIDPTKQTVYEEEIQHYSHITLFAHAEGSENSAARLTIWRNNPGQAGGEITRIEKVTVSTWERLDLNNSYGRMVLIVEPSTQANATAVNHVDVLLHLRAK